MGILSTPSLLAIAQGLDFKKWQGATNFMILRIKVFFLAIVITPVSVVYPSVENKRWTVGESLIDVTGRDM
jgi:hypothetical protein